MTGGGTADGALPSGRAIDAVARDVIAAAGHGDHFGHGTGHGIGLATHEAPSLGRLAPDDAAAEPDRLLGGARRLPRRARWASGSRTSCCSTPAPGGSSASPGSRATSWSSGLTPAVGARYPEPAMSVPFDPFGFVGSMMVLSLLIPVVTTVLILAVIVWAIRRAGPAREDPAIAELKARLARGEIDPIEYQVRMRALRGGDD